MREKVDKKNKFPDFPLKPEKGKIRLVYRKFPSEGKSRLFIENFRREGKTIYINILKVFFPTVTGDKKCGGLSCRHTQLFPLTVTKAISLKGKKYA